MGKESMRFEGPIFLVVYKAWPMVVDRRDHRGSASDYRFRKQDKRLTSAISGPEASYIRTPAVGS